MTTTGKDGWLHDNWASRRGLAQVGLLAALVVLGIALIALPDNDDRVFSLSPGHGPAPLDLLGSVLLSAGWLGLLARPVLRWRAGSAAMGGRAGVTALVLGGFGAGLLVASVLHQLSWWWAIGAGILGAVQLWFVVLSLRVNRAG